MLEHPWQPYQQIQVAIVPPEYENKSEMRPFVMGGVPYLSLTERVTDQRWLMFGAVAEGRFSDHVCEPIWNLPEVALDSGEWQEALKQAGKRWQQLIEDSKNDPAALTGSLESFRSVDSIEDVNELMSSSLADR